MTSSAVLDDVACLELFSCDDHVGTPFRPDDTEMVIIDPGRPTEAKRPDAATVAE